MLAKSKKRPKANKSLLYIELDNAKYCKFSFVL